MMAAAAAAAKAAVTPRLIIHGGAGNVTRNNLSHEQWLDYERSLLEILRSTNALLIDEHATALDAAVHAVQLFEAHPGFNAGRGAVFTRSGHNELEASVMVSSGMRKRGAAVSMLKHVKSPVSLAAEILRRGERDDNGGAQGHVHISGSTAEELAGSYGLELVDQDYFWTKKRWDEHLKDLERVGSVGLARRGECAEYLPQGTVGCVVLDRYGTVAVATSTGGMTNKLDGRIGDTPTFGAGFWAEEWTHPAQRQEPSLISSASSLLQSCLPSLAGYVQAPSGSYSKGQRHVVGVLGTGNGDSFLRVAATRTAAAAARFSHVPLADSVTWMAGPHGQLQQSASDRWNKTFEGQGGIIGIESVDGRGQPVCDFNCGGLFRAWIDDDGNEHAMVFKDKY